MSTGDWVGAVFAMAACIGQWVAVGAMWKDYRAAKADDLRAARGLV